MLRLIKSFQPHNFKVEVWKMKKKKIRKRRKKENANSKLLVKVEYFVLLANGN